MADPTQVAGAGFQLYSAYTNYQIQQIGFGGTAYYYKKQQQIIENQKELATLTLDYDIGEIGREQDKLGLARKELKLKGKELASQKRVASYMEAKRLLSVAGAKQDIKEAQRQLDVTARAEVAVAQVMGGGGRSAASRAFTTHALTRGTSLATKGAVLEREAEIGKSLYGEQRTQLRLAGRQLRLQGKGIDIASAGLEAREDYLSGKYELDIETLGYQQQQAKDAQKTAKKQKEAAAGGGLGKAFEDVKGGNVPTFDY